MGQKIIFLASCPHSLLNFRLHLMQAFIQRNFTVTAIAPNNDKVADRLATLGIQFIPFQLSRNGRNPFYDLKSMIQLIRLLRKEKADYLFSYTIKPVIYGSFAAYIAHIPKRYAMITGLGYAFSNTTITSKLIGYLVKPMFRFTLKFNNVIFFQNKENADLFLASKLIDDPKKVAIVNGSGVDVHYFNYKPIKQHANLSFLMIARLLYDKGIREYIEAAKRIKEKHPAVTFNIAGWIDTNPNAISHQELDHWIKSKIIDYLGKLDDVRDAITNASVYVLPSYAEGTPRTVLEAMAIGRPIITTAIPGCKDTVVPYVNGFLIPARDVESLCTAISYFIENPAQIEKMGIKSRELVVHKYDVHQVNASILKAMQLH